MKVIILGTEYTVKIKKYEDDECFARDGIEGYSDPHKKEIVILDIESWDEWKNEDRETVKNYMKEILRHEIVHSFLSESGLGHSTNQFERGWAKNEEMVDWIALQLPKIVEACKEVGAM